MLVASCGNAAHCMQLQDALTKIGNLEDALERAYNPDTQRELAAIVNSQRGPKPKDEYGRPLVETMEPDSRVITLVPESAV